MTDKIIESKAKQYPSWYTVAKKKELRKAGQNRAFGFDCVNLIKAILWGWRGDKNQIWGGAKYNSNGVSDISANNMIAKCHDISTDFSNIVKGEVV